MAVVTADIGPGVRGGPVSLDGYAAGPNQSEDLPFGEGVDGRLHTWMFDHADENRAEIDGIVNAGAYILGRNMFGPGRGDWDLDWKGWWGPEPPYHAPAFVLTHHHRDRSRWTAARHSRSSRTDPSPPLRRPSGPRGWAVGDRRRRRHPQPVPVAGRDRRASPSRRADHAWRGRTRLRRRRRPDVRHRSDPSHRASGAHDLAPTRQVIDRGRRRREG